MGVASVLEGGLQNNIGITMVSYHNILIANVHPDWEPVAVVSVHTADGVLSDVHLVGGRQWLRSRNGQGWRGRDGCRGYCLGFRFGGADTFGRLYHMTLNGISCLRAILGRICICEIRPRVNISRLDGLEPSRMDRNCCSSMQLSYY